MKRVRKPAQPATLAIPKEMGARAQEKLERDYVAFLAGTATEDPKLFMARIAAAREALEHLTQLRAMAGEPPPGEPAEPSSEEVLEAARLDIARENKT